MANELVLKRNLTGINLVLSGIPVTSTSEAVSADVLWRWEDEPTMEPRLLGRGVAGHELVVPFDAKGRDVRLFLVSKTAKGKPDVTDFREAVQTVVTAPADAIGSTEVEAGEDLAAFDLVNIYNDGGDIKARRADASDPDKYAVGFVREAVVVGGSLAAGSTVRVFFVGNIMDVAGRTVGAPQFLDNVTPGAVTETPVTGSGRISQQIGWAISTTQVIFDPQEPILQT